MAPPGPAISGCRATAVVGDTGDTGGGPPLDSGGPPPLDCVICFAPYDRLFKVPKVLGCGHIFCLECLARVTVGAPAADPPTLLCPICRRPTALPPRRGPPALPTPPDLLALLPPGPTATSIRFNRPKGLLYVPPPHPKTPDQLPTVTLSLELGRPDPPPPQNQPQPQLSGRCVLGRALALTLALMVGGGLAFCGVFLFFIQPAAYEEGGPLPNTTWGAQSWPPF
ncbi:RING finger protein 225-like [Strix aluco]|uniref:RING finger protein 225-like n=1 Tax=Strix aluco TaxID=111821 RepID=UPI003DA2BFDA